MIATNVGSLYHSSHGDELLLGVYVLNKSFKDTVSTRDMVTLVSDGVSPYVVLLLQVFFLFIFPKG